MTISVVCPTNRIGGLDLLFESLEQQTHKDFELVLVDMLHKYRSERVAHEASERTFPITHIPPRDNPFPDVAYCAAMNTGIAHARGDTLVFLCDYSWLAPDCLATHAIVQSLQPGPVHLDYDYCDLPPLKVGFPGYHQDGIGGSDEGFVEALNATTDRYVADLKSGRLDRYMWSLFAQFPSAERIRELPVHHKHRPCATRKDGDWNWCSFKNESFPTELFLKMNGLNELLDASHCYQDQEFSYRLRSLGIPWTNGPIETGMVTVVNPRPVLNVKRLSAPIAHNAAIANAGGVDVNPGFSLRAWRQMVLEPGPVAA